MKMVVSQSTMSQARKPAKARKETKRVNISHMGFTLIQQLVHNREVLTWPFGKALGDTSQSGRVNKRLSYMVVSSHLEEPSFLQIIHKAPMKETPTMPKQTMSYQYTSNSCIFAFIKFVNLNFDLWNQSLCRWYKVLGLEDRVEANQADVHVDVDQGFLVGLRLMEW